MTPPRSDQPTHLYVRNLLGDPDDPQLVFGDLTENQRVGLALVRIADELAEMQKYGCIRLRRLESWYFKLVGAGIALTVIASATALIMTILRTFR